MTKNQKGLERAWTRHEGRWKDNRYVYAVVSRRSGGVSVGINLNPDKACNFDCIYCQVDRQTPPSVRNVDLAVLSAELGRVLEAEKEGTLYAFAYPSTLSLSNGEASETSPSRGTASRPPFLASPMQFGSPRRRGNNSFWLRRRSCSSRTRPTSTDPWCARSRGPGPAHEVPRPGRPPHGARDGRSPALDQGEARPEEERSPGRRRVLQASLLMTLSDIYGEIGLYDAGEPLARKALGIREQALGPSHPDVAANLDNLANIWRTQGRLAEAEALARRSLQGREAVLGPNDLDVAQSLNDLAIICWNQGRLADAEPLLEHSLKIREARLGPVHPEVATSLNNIATLHADQGKLADAEPLYRERP